MENGIRIIEVTTKKQQKEFIEFPLRLYKGNPFFVPPLYGDEKKLFTDKNTYNLTCKSVFFIAENNGETVGRIQGIIQNQYNQIHGVSQARFTRFDCEKDEKIASALFSAVENWAKEQGANQIVGPLGYSDLEREGLLIDGFCYLSTYEEQYNYPYYQGLIERQGYQKDVDWVEYRIYPEVYNHEKLMRYGERALKKCNLHFGGVGLSKKAYIEKYKEGIFNCIDECYKDLYGTVPFTPEMIQQMVEQFQLVVNMKYIFVLCDEDEKVVAFGLGLPGIGRAVQASGGRLTPITIIKLLKEIAKPKTIDLALIGILPKYRNSGLNAIVLAKLQDMILKEKIQYLETNLNLEYNVSVQGQWRHFKHIQHKRRRCFKKDI